MLKTIAESIAELHITWCGAPLNPLHPEHNFACLTSFQRLEENDKSMSTDTFGDPGTGRAPDPFGDPITTRYRDYSYAEERAEVPRDQWDRYLVPAADGTKPAVNKGRLRVSTIKSVGSDTRLLEDRAERLIVKGLGMDPALNAEAMRAAALPEDSKEQRRALRMVAAKAFDRAGGNDRRELGNKMHELTDALNRGNHDPIPPELQPEIDAYYAALKEHNLQVLPEYMERVVLCPYDTGGAFDNIMRRWNPLTEAYELVIVDLKTGKTLDYSRLEFLIQLWMYANAYYMWVTDAIDYDEKGKITAVRGHVEEMPLELRRDRAIVIHVPLDGSAEVLELDLSGVDRYAAASVELKRANAEAKHKYRSLGVVRPAAFAVPSAQPKPATADAPAVTPDQQAQTDLAAKRLATVDAMAKAAGRNDDPDDGVAAPPAEHDPVTGRKRRTCGHCRKPGHTRKNCPEDPESPKYVAPVPAGDPAPENNCDCLGDGDWHPHNPATCENLRPIQTVDLPEQPSMVISPAGPSDPALPYCTMAHTHTWTGQHPDAPGQWVCSVSGKPGEMAWKAGQTRITAVGPSYGHPDGDHVTHLNPAPLAADQADGDDAPPPPATWPAPLEQPDMVAWGISQALTGQALLAHRDACMRSGTWTPEHDQQAAARYPTLPPA